MTPDELSEELNRYATSKRGAEVGRTVELRFAQWGSFFEITEDDEGEYARFPVRDDRLKQLMAEFPAIRQSDWVPRDGHVFMDVPLDAGLPLSTWKKLIDESYDLVWEKVDDEGRFVIELAMRPYDEPSLLDRLIEKYDLQEYRDQILQLVRTAAYLQTRSVDEDSIPVGGSKLGGKPDLPPDVEWPVVNFEKNPNHGEPLAFLGQIDLADVAKVGAVIPGVPTQGLISVFSAYGWLLEDNYDCWQPYSNVVLFSAPGQVLERRELPELLNQYQSLTPMAVDPVAMMSLPSYREESAFSELTWTDEEYERFDDMQMSFRSLQMYHWKKTFDELASQHRFGGYARFPQMFPDELLDDEHSRMLVQFASDDEWCSGMNWAGDGGDFVVYCDMRNGQFENVQVYMQGS